MMKTKDKLVNHLNCQNCGGPLHPQLGEQVVVCPYCQSAQHLDIDWKTDGKDETNFFTVPQDSPQSQSYSEYLSNTNSKQGLRKIIRILFLIFFFIILFIILYQILRMMLFDPFPGF